jgi:hypothetical protein
MSMKRISRAMAVAFVALFVGAGVGAQGAEASSCYYSPRGCVYVQGYYKPSTGTYVRPYVRNYPGYGSYGYRYRPSYSYSYPSYSYRSYSYPSYSYRSYSYRW